MVSTITIAKTVGVTDYNPPFREKGTTEVWPYKDVYSVGTTRRGLEKFYGYAGLPIAQKRGENQAFPVFDWRELGETTIYIHKFMLAARMSREAVQDAVHIRNIAGELGSMMGESHAQAEAQFAALPFLLSTDATNFPMWDSVEMCGTHTLQDGSSYVNNFTPSTINHDNIWTDLNDYRWNYRTHVGTRQYDKVVAVMIAPDALPNWTKLLQNEKEPDTMDNNDNFLKGMGLKIIVNPYMSSATERLYIGSKFKEKCKFIWRERLQTDQDEDKGTQGVIWLSWFRAGLGVIDFLAIARNAGV